MYELNNSFEHFKNRERDLITKADNERLARSISTDKKPNRALSNMGHLMVKVGTHLVEAYSETDLTIQTLPAPATGQTA